jgi:hypothetical protein
VRVYAGAAPAGIDVVTVVRGAGTLIVLAPDGEDHAVVREQLLGQLTPAERDCIRMALGRPPVGASTGPTWAPLAGLRWTPDVLPPAVRLPGTETGRQVPLPLPTRRDRIRSWSVQARLTVGTGCAQLAATGHADGLGGMAGRRAGLAMILLVAMTCAAQLLSDVSDLVGPYT